MNITEFMSFDLEWFTTLPGLLITGGVIVLLIALIIFIISNRKANKKIEEGVVEAATETQESVVPSAAEPPVEPQMQINEMAATIDLPVVPEVTNNPVNNGVVNEPVDITYNSSGSVNILGNPQTNGVMPPVSTAVEIPTFFEQNIPSNPMNDSNSIVTSNPVDFSINNEQINPTVNSVAVEAPVVSKTVMPQVDATLSTPTVQMVQPEVQVAQVVEQPTPQPTIYGGVNPINTVNTTPVVEEVKPVIYGGANPLENTTTLPVMNNNGAYNANGSNSYTEPTPAVQNFVPPVAEVTQPVVQEVPIVATSTVNQTPVEPATVQQMPMTGAEMFGTNDNNNSGSNNSSNEIETLEF